jgi:hypothetical protein
VVNVPLVDTRITEVSIFVPDDAMAVLKLVAPEGFSAEEGKVEVVTSVVTEFWRVTAALVKADSEDGRG